MTQSSSGAGGGEVAAGESAGLVIPFSFPLAPSANHMYVGMGRHKSLFYKSWLKECAAIMLAAGVRRVEDKQVRWRLEYTMVVPNWRRRDLSNTLKPVEDFLAEWLGLEDNYNIDITLHKRVDGGSAGCVYGEVKIG